MKNYQEIRVKLGQDRVKVEELMSKHTTFKIGGPADLFYEAKTKKELVKAIKLVRELKVPYFILGGGSNVLVSDKGIRGIVIKMKNDKWSMANGKLKVAAAVSLPLLVQETARRGLSGLEFCKGIPGTIGGAIVGNAGTKNEGIGSLVEKVEVLDQDGKIKTISRKDCRFSYRESRFKDGSEIILAVVLKLTRDKPTNIKQKLKKYLQIRASQPQDSSAGSIFRNPSLGLPVGKLIEEVGLKGKKVGQAQISGKHANFIVNLGGAKSTDVLKLISLAKKEVKKKFGINLVEEIKIMGEF